MTKQYLYLFQLADSAWPTGGFALSNGFEALMKLGHLKDTHVFVEYLESYLRQISEADLAFMNSIYMLNEEDYSYRFHEIWMDWHAFQHIEAMRCANALLGENWFRMIRSVYSPRNIDKMKNFFDEKNRPMYFTIVFPRLLRMIRVELLVMHKLFYHMAVRDQTGAAIRLGVIGPEMAQRIHFRLIDTCEKLRVQYKDRTYEEACRSHPLLELAQSSHQYLYSRIFQN